MLLFKDIYTVFEIDQSKQQTALQTQLFDRLEVITLFTFKKP